MKRTLSLFADMRFCLMTDVGHSCCDCHYPWAVKGESCVVRFLGTAKRIVYSYPRILKRNRLLIYAKKILLFKAVKKIMMSLGVSDYKYIGVSLYSTSNAI